MEVSFERDTIDSYETVAQVTLCQEETMESIVPDACPDILHIVDVCGQAMLNGKQARDGVAQVSGTVRASILYRPEGAGGLRKIELTIPFTCQAEAAGLTPEGSVLASPRLVWAEARALNPRKVLLRVDLAVDITACQPTLRSIICGVEGVQEDSTLCQRQYTGEHYQLAYIQEKPFTFSDHVRLPAGNGGPPQLLAVQALPFCNESKQIGSKLIFKGLVELCLLLQEPGGGAVSSHESLPFSQILELPGTVEDGDSQLEVEVTDLRCTEEQGDGCGLQVDLELLVQAQVRTVRPMTILQDLYSTSHLMEVENGPQRLCRKVEQSIRPQAVRELVETGEIVRAVVDARLCIGQISQSREGDDLVLSADVQLAVLYLDEDEVVQCVHRSIPVACRLEGQGGQRCMCRCTSPGEVFAAPAAGGVEVRSNLEFHCLTTQEVMVPAVAGAQLGEMRCAEEGRRPSVVLRLARSGEQLWDIAKAHGTTQQRILQANGLEDEQLPGGRMLLIPSSR